MHALIWHTAHSPIPKFECNYSGMESICLEIDNRVSMSLTSSIYITPQRIGFTVSSPINCMADKQLLYHDDLTFIGHSNFSTRK